MDEDARVRSMRNLVHARLPDPIAETVMQFHVLRLMGNESMYDELRPTHNERIEANLECTGIPRHTFEWVDRITDLADMVSFYFCFGLAVENSVPVYAKLSDEHQAKVTYEIHAEIV